MQKNDDKFPQITENIYGHRKKLLFLADGLKNASASGQIPPARFKVLDVGCGNAEAVTFPLASLGYAMTALDIYPPVIEYARAHNPYPNLQLVCGDLMELTGEFNAIIISDVLEHVTDPEGFLIKFHQLLVPGGTLLITVPNGFGPFEVENFFVEKPLFWLSYIKRKLQKLPPPPWSDLPYNLDSGHIQHFTFQHLKQTVKKMGFKIKTVQAGGFLGGYLSDLLWGSRKSLVNWNVRVSDKLPLCLASMWYFNLEKA